MSRLDKLFGKSKEYTIGGEKFMFEPLGLEHIDLVMDLENTEKRAKSIVKMIELTLIKAVPDATPDEVKRLGLAYFKSLVHAVQDVNGIVNDNKGQDTPKTE